jgi:phosphoribosylformylglycinamidine synthase subunit PurQ / glutaminase
MHAAVITFPGSNRDTDIARALKKAGAKVTMAWHQDQALPAGTDLAVLPGGFSYGDYLRCGAIASRAPIMDAVRTHAARGGLVLGVCNGFQIACEAGLLPGLLMRNAQLRFICRMQHLKVSRNDTAFTNRYAKDQVIEVFTYCDAEGRAPSSANPNGAEGHVAGIYSAKRNVLGMMPHPENLIDPAAGGVDGLGMFQSLVQSGLKAA